MKQFLTYDITGLHSLALKYEFNLSWNYDQITLLSPNFIAYITELGQFEQHSINLTPTPRIHRIDNGRLKNHNDLLPSELAKECRIVANGLNKKRLHLIALDVESASNTIHPSRVFPLKLVYSKPETSSVDIKKKSLHDQMVKSIRAYKDYTGKTSPVSGTMAKPSYTDKYVAIIGDTVLYSPKSHLMVWKHHRNQQGHCEDIMTAISDVNVLKTDFTLQFSKFQLKCLTTQLKNHSNPVNFVAIPISKVLDHNDTPSQKGYKYTYF